MADLKKKFDAAAKDSQKLSSRPDDAEMLQLYANYKQATVGDAPDKRPGAFDIRGRAKHDAWAKLRGMKSDKAMQYYIDLVERLKKKS